MKCSKCGKSFKDIKAIGAHYRKAHPGAMKARKPRAHRSSDESVMWFVDRAIKDHERRYH